VNAAQRKAAARVEDGQRRLDALLDERVSLLTALDRVAALRGTARLVREATGANAGFVAELTRPDRAVIRWLSGNQTEALAGLVVPVGQGLGGRVLAIGHPAQVADYLTASSITHHFDNPVRVEGLRGLLAAPVFDPVTGQAVALAYVALRTRGEFGPAAIDALQRVSADLGVALRAAEQATHLSTTAVAAERRRLQVSLHDSVGAMLFSIGAQIRDLYEEAGADSSLASRLHRLQAEVAEASGALRESLLALSENTPGRALPATVAEHCRSFQTRTGVSTRFVQLGALPALDVTRAEALVATVREGLLNVEKHADAASVVVSLGPAEGGVQVAVANDTAGPARPAALGLAALGPGVLSSGLGLATLAERLSCVAGRMSFVRDEEDGCTLRAWVPAVTRAAPG
jgi:LuxR family transcriptional regulator, regulator of acetate metabolism